MKKLILFIILLPVFAAAQTWKNSDATNVYEKGMHKFKYVPFVTNSGGTITDTLTKLSDMRSYVALHGGTSSETTARIDSVVTAISDTTDLQTEFSTIIPKVINMSAAEIAAIESPADGMMLYDETLHKLKFWNGSTWKIIATE